MNGAVNTVWVILDLEQLYTIDKEPAGKGTFDLSKSCDDL